MTTVIANSKATDETQLRALIDDRAKAARDKSVNEAISSIAPDILSFDVVNPFQQMGSGPSNEENQSSARFLAASEIGYEIRDLSITADVSVVVLTQPQP